MHFGSPHLCDDEITLRRWTHDDIPLIVRELGTHRDISQWTRVPWPYHREHAEAFIEHQRETWAAGTDATFAIAATSTGEVLGSVGVHRLGAPVTARSSHLPDEVGYWLSPSARGRGAATRAVVLVRDWVTGPLEMPELALQVGDGNDPSRRVAERAGFTYLGLVDASEYDDDHRSFHRYTYRP